MKKYLLFVSFLFVLTLLGACDNDENQADVTLLNTWVLVSYGNESKEVLKEVEGYYYILTFNPNNTYSGWAYMNEIGGEYKCRGNKIEISYPDITKVYYEGTDPDMFFMEHLHEVNTYQISDRELRLYYSKDQFFKFRIKDNKS